MSLNKDQIDGLLKLIGLTKAEEIDCGQCLHQIAEFAEVELEGRSIDQGLLAVAHHLTVCSECREEYEALQGGIDGDSGVVRGLLFSCEKFSWPAGKSPGPWVVQSTEPKKSFEVELLRRDHFR